jgi:ATP-dependent RNA helicase DDX27
MWGPGTIESDDDVAADDSSSEEEEKESVFDAKRTKKTKAVESKGPVTAKEINPDFEYGSDDGEATPSGGCSWNFQAAIQKIQEQDKADGFDNSGGVDYLQKKINEKRRRRRITEKKAKDDAAAGMTPKEALAAAKKAKKLQEEEDAKLKAAEDEEEEEDDDEEEDEEDEEADEGEEEEGSEGSDEAEEESGDDEEESGDEDDADLCYICKCDKGHEMSSHDDADDYEGGVGCDKCSANCPKQYYECETCDIQWCEACANPDGAKTGEGEGDEDMQEEEAADEAEAEAEEEPEPEPEPSSSEEELSSSEDEDGGAMAEEEQRLQQLLQQSAEDDQAVEDTDMAEDFFEKAEEDKTQGMKFTDMNLSRPILRAIQALGFTEPTDIQRRAVPVGLAGKDLCASAETGSGKTAAFLLPILERLQYRPRKVCAIRVLIITPTRELATQCHSVLTQLARYTDITSSCIVGGMGMGPQQIELRGQPDVVICTPGRMIDHVHNSRAVHLDDVQMLVLDEADRLLEMGFTDEVQELVGMCPKGRQSMMFSATLNTKVEELLKFSLNRPVLLRAHALFDMSQLLVQEFVRVRENREPDREAILLALCKRTFKTKTIVFFEKKWQVRRRDGQRACVGVRGRV